MKPKLGMFDLNPAEIELLRQATLVADVLERLENEARTCDLTVTDKRGELKSHPVLVELRSQQQRYASLIASLRLPDAEDDRPQRRGGARGTYKGMKRGRETGRTYGSGNLRVGNDSLPTRVETRKDSVSLRGVV